MDDGSSPFDHHNVPLLVGGLNLKNISQLGWLFPIHGKIKHVPNHQPDRGFRHANFDVAMCVGAWTHEACELSICALKVFLKRNHNDERSKNIPKNWVKSLNLQLLSGHLTVCHGKFSTSSSMIYRKKGDVPVRYAKKTQGEVHWNIIFRGWFTPGSPTGLSTYHPAGRRYHRTWSQSCRAPLC